MQATDSLALKLWHAFHAGGFVMWFVFLFGLLAVGAAGRFAWRGERQLVPFVGWMTLTTLVSGAFGWVVGMTKVLEYVVNRVKPEERATILLAGTREALSNVSASLMFCVFICLLVSIGYRRYPFANASASRSTST